MLASTLWKIDLRLGVSYSSPFCFWTRMEKWHGNLSCFGREFASSLYSLKCIWKGLFILWKMSQHHYSHVELLNIYFNGSYELLFSLGCTSVCVWGGGDWQAFLLEVAILLVDLNYCVINFFFFFLWHETSLPCVYTALQQPKCFKCHSEQFKVSMRFDHRVVFNCFFWAW